MAARARRLLMIAPHADDEVIGCGGAIAKAVSQGTRVDVVVMGLGGILHRSANEAVSNEKRHAELAASNKLLGVTGCKVLYPGREMRLHEIPLLELVTALDAVLDEGYDEIYLPPADHNGDHRRTHEAALAALRPGARRLPDLIAVYESVSSSWVAAAAGGSMYIDISDHIGTKLEALRCYSSQLQEYPHPVSVEAVRRMAAFRAAEAGCDACEHFSLLRLIR